MSRRCAFNTRGVLPVINGGSPRGSICLRDRKNQLRRALKEYFAFHRELNAAEFFVSSAIKGAKKDGDDYKQAKNDLELIRGRLRAAQSKR